MRDSEVMGHLQQARQRVAKIYRQMVFVDTRMQALEQYLMSGLFSRLILIMWPSAAMGAIDKLQLKLMQEHDDQMRKAAEQQKAAPQKLTIVTPNGVQEKTING